MGEVFLAHDPTCERVVALKRIRSEYLKYESVKQRFLKEAKIAAQLSHPSIIPIYFIHQEENEAYYTMPFIEGDSLKEILKNTIEREKNSESPHPIGSSIGSLVRIFLNVCQAISFAHSKKIIHRDLKPGNIMVGKFGQVLILDWGLAKYLIEDYELEEDIEIPDSIPHELTRPGKAVGTLTYMAPERAFSHPASIQSDIYALGVILYQLLTLKTPFRRKSLSEFRKNAKYERLIDPIEAAPERDIPLQLSEIIKKCLAFHPEERYQHVSELIHALEHYIEGKPDWIFQNQFAIDDKEIWEFQENILLSRNVALTRSSEMMQWVMLMISKGSYTGNFKIEADLAVSYSSQGIGLLFCIPEAASRRELEEGYCLWIGTKKNPGIRLYRSNIEVLNISEVSIKKGKSYHLVIEKIENRVSLFLDGQLVLNFVGYIPIVGSHIGLVCKDMDFKIENWNVYVGSQSAMINCLSVPDAFLASKDFHKAFQEYQRIAQSFKGRAEGREAVFRAGVTLLEKAKETQNTAERQKCLNQSNFEFEKLEKTSGAPLEYLGKSMIYKLDHDIEEEIKCLELGLRKYPRHPLIHMLQEQIIFRMHETTRMDRKQTYAFALLALHFFPDALKSKETLFFFKSIEKNIELISLFLKPPYFKTEKERFVYLTIRLSLWMKKKTYINEILYRLEEPIAYPEIIIGNCLFSLLYLHAYEDVAVALERIESSNYSDNAKIDYLIGLVKICYQANCLPKFGNMSPSPYTQIFDSAKSQYSDDPTQPYGKHRLTNSLDQLSKFINGPIGKMEIEAIYYLYDAFLPHISSNEWAPFSSFIDQLKISSKYRESIDILHVKILLLLKDFHRARSILERYPSEVTHPLSHFYAPYAIYLMATDGKKRLIESYRQLIELPHPPVTALLAHYVSKYIDIKGKWADQALFLEKRSLYEQLYIMYIATNKKNKALMIQSLMKN
ncbi:MAG: protein kinase [Simkaniaceae bacterium]|nr:protein kinase [Simkaniaceae bacterium]